MTVQCGACGAENRDAAKFCKGCGRKIAQAWPQAAPMAASDGAALLASAAALLPPASKTATADEKLRPTPAPPRPRIGNGRWIVGLGIGVALLVLASAWWGHRNKSQEITQPAPALDASGAHQPAAVEAAVPAPATAVTTLPSASTSMEPQEKPEPAAAEGTAPQASTKPRKPMVKKPAAPPPAPVVEAVAPPPPVPAPEPVRVPTPQESCAGRNFIARAQCMAEQCARADVGRHPQCEAVRQQQRIEEEKRNPTMAG